MIASLLVLIACTALIAWAAVERRRHLVAPTPRPTAELEAWDAAQEAAMFAGKDWPESIAIADRAIRPDASPTPGRDRPLISWVTPSPAERRAAAAQRANVAAQRVRDAERKHRLTRLERDQLKRDRAELDEARRALKQAVSADRVLPAPSAPHQFSDGTMLNLPTAPDPELAAWDARA